MNEKISITNNGSSVSDEIRGGLLLINPTH